MPCSENTKQANEQVNDRHVQCEHQPIPYLLTLFGLLALEVLLFTSSRDSYVLPWSVVAFPGTGS